MNGLPVKVNSFRTASGWGYEIIVNSKTFIHQDFIPAVEGYQSFQSREDAVKVGNLVVEKLVTRKPPQITVDELKGLNIKNVSGQN